MAQSGQDILDIIRSAVSERSLFAPGVSRVALAVSGGADSVCLLHAMTRLCGEFGVCLCVAHLNHGVRGADADADQEFVRELAAAHGLEYFTETVDVPSMLVPGGPSLEQACREQRMAFYDRALEALGAQRIATAHTMSDQAETMLLRLLRGASLRGLAAMSFRTGNIVRPLLAAPRARVREYVRANALEFREDATNADERHGRNRVRHTLMPLLEKEFNPRAERSLFALSQLLRADSDYLEQEAARALGEAAAARAPGEMRLQLSKLAALPDALLRRALVLAYYETVAASPAPGLRQQHALDLAHAVKRGGTGHVVELPGGVTAVRGYEQIVFSSTRDTLETGRLGIECALDQARLMELLNGEGAGPVVQHCAPLGVTLEFSIVSADRNAIFGNHDPDTAYFDPQSVRGPLTVRTPVAGDRFRPLGMGADKKLQDFFVDEKTPRAQRRNAPLLVCGGRIMWIIGKRIDDRFKAVRDARTALRVRRLK